MWTAQRAPSRPTSRTSISSVHSVASTYNTASRPNSMASPQQQQRRFGGYESDTSSIVSDDELAIQNLSFPSVPSNNNGVPAMWQTRRQNSGTSVSRLSQKFAANAPEPRITTQKPAARSLDADIPYFKGGDSDIPYFTGLSPPPIVVEHRRSPDNDSHSLASTLGGDDQDFEFPEKTPRAFSHSLTIDVLKQHPAAQPKSNHIPGPLESQLASIMSKLVFMERANPVVSVTPDDYNEMKTRLAALEAEKKTWQKRHEALFALRDEDVENNIKIRGMLAKARRDLEAMTKLRDEDLVNVQVVRAKLSDTTRQLDRLQSQNGRASPPRGGRPGSMMERRGTLDLFAVAKAAALEQRALELEKRNSELSEQLEQLKGGANIDDLNRMTAHKAWKDTVSDLELKVKAKDAELSRLRSSSTSSTAAPSGPAVGGAGNWNRLEAVHEEHASYREKVGGKMQALRSEKEQLQRELHRKEDENHALEVKVQSLQRRISLQG